MDDKVKNLKGKLVSVAQTFLDKIGSVLHVLPDVAKPTLCNLLHAQFKKTIVESVVKFIFCVIAVYLAVFKPFGEQSSLWISSLLFIGMLLWTIFESVSYCMLLIMIVQERSVRTGIIEFVKWKFPKVSIGSDIYEIARIFGPRFSSHFQNLRSSNDVIWDFIVYLAKNAITFVSIFSLYILLVHWIFKPIILENFAGLTIMQIYLFPIRQFL